MYDYTITQIIIVEIQILKYWLLLFLILLFFFKEIRNWWVYKNTKSGGR